MYLCIQCEAVLFVKSAGSTVLFQSLLSVGCGRRIAPEQATLYPFFSILKAWTEDSRLFPFEKLPDISLTLSSTAAVGVTRGYTDHYQGRGHSIRPTATVINIHEHLI